MDLPSLDCVQQDEYSPFDPIIKRTEGTVLDTTTNERFKCTKGAPHVILKLVLAANGCDPKTAEHVESDVLNLGLRGIRSIAVAKTDKNGILLHFIDCLILIVTPV